MARMKKMYSNAARPALLAGVLLATAACSFSVGETPSQAAEKLIEGELGVQLELELTDAECDGPESAEAGETFFCTAQTSNGETVKFGVDFDTEDDFFAYATNVVLPDDLALIEQDAATVLSPDVGVTIDPADVSCPDETTVLDNDGELICEITDPTTGDRFVVNAVFGPYERGSGYESVFYQIGEKVN
ncbi:MAG: hypothetical protein ACJAR2_003334 [Ilumatobacter sp.]|jgi:hypothetical protein